jgi:hypothetical protein
LEEKGLTSAGAASCGGGILCQVPLARWDGGEGPRALGHAKRRGTEGRVGEGRARARGGWEEKCPDWRLRLARAKSAVRRTCRCVPFRWNGTRDRRRTPTEESQTPSHCVVSDKTGAIQIQRPFAAVFAQFLFKVIFEGNGGPLVGRPGPPGVAPNPQPPGESVFQNLA